jgi:hypothetical protein
MNKERILGLLRELLMVVGSALIAFGILKEGFDILPAVGAVMAVASLVGSVFAKEGVEILFSLIRKVLSAGGGALVAYGAVTPDQVEAVMAILAPVLSLIWSWTSKSSEHGGPSFPAPVIVFLFSLACLALPSCSVKVNPDGSKDVLIDAQGVGQVIPILLEGK